MVLNALLRNVHICFILFNADVVPIQVKTSQCGRTSTHKRIKNNHSIIGAGFNNSLNEMYWLLRWVIAFFLVKIDVIPHVCDSHFNIEGMRYVIMWIFEV